MTSTPVLTAQASPDPMAPFVRLVGGEWHAEDSYHVFEWGVARKLVHSRTYFRAEGEARLVSEGIWFWHPEEQTHKGYVVATDMPVEVFEYRTRFDGDVMTNMLRSYGPQGGHYRETWEFDGGDRYRWSLYRQGEAGDEWVMGGSYRRKPADIPPGRPADPDTAGG